MEKYIYGIIEFLCFFDPLPFLFRYVTLDEILIYKG